MASKKNRSGKSNRKSPKSPSSLRARVSDRFSAVRRWAESHHWATIAGALVFLFVASLLGGYWIAARLDSMDRDRVAREILQDMKQEGGGASAPQQRPQASPS